jgi:hypothetical protein
MIHVLYENPAWLPPLAAALEARGLPWEARDVSEGDFHVEGDIPPGVWLNRMSPSAHTRGHAGGIHFVREWLGVLEERGARVINGSGSFALEVSKVRQHAALHAMGILTPRTIAVIGRSRLREAARQMSLPFITKHNQGGKGLGVQLFRDLAAFDRFVEGEDWEEPMDSVMLLQEYIEPPSRSITRVEIVDGRLLFAMRSATDGGFELCPADSCQIGEAFCPVGEEPASRFDVQDLAAADPLVADYLRFCKRHHIDVAGIEYVTGADGRRYTYDINMNTNYNSAVERAAGVDGMGAVAALCERELGRLGRS